MFRTSLKTLIAVPGVLFGSGLWFITATVSIGGTADSLLVLAGALGMLVAAAAVVRWRDLLPVGSDGTWDLWAAVVAGALSFWAAPLLALSQRATDAPSGSESLFFTTAVWGGLGVLAVVVLGRRPFVAISAMVLALSGSAAVLANWERPSSFSPLVKFPQREAWMIVAGVLFVFGILLFERVLRRERPGTAFLWAAGGATVTALVWATPALLSVAGSTFGASRGILLSAAIAMASLAFSVLWLVGDRGAGRTFSVLLLTPVAMMVLSWVERSTRVFGPDPIRWSQVRWGAASCLVGAGVTWLVLARDAGPGVRTIRWRDPVVLVAVLAVLVGLASLFTPALAASVVSTYDQTFRAEWTMFGYESAAGWMAFSASLLALGAVLVARCVRERLVGSAAALAALWAAGASLALAPTPLRTWNRWIPARIQQWYGTEYAQMDTKPVHDVTRFGVLGLAVVVALLVLTVVVRGHDVREPEESENQ